MSADYYGRLEQQRGPQPSTQILAALARGMRLTLHDLEQAQALLVLTATPGTESYEKLALLAVLGRQRMSG